MSNIASSIQATKFNFIQRAFAIDCKRATRLCKYYNRVMFTKPLFKSGELVTVLRNTYTEASGLERLSALIVEHVEEDYFAAAANPRYKVLIDNQLHYLFESDIDLHPGDLVTVLNSRYTTAAQINGLNALIVEKERESRDGSYTVLIDNVPHILYRNELQLQSLDKSVLTKQNW